ncbi:MAG: hypothetical protein ONB37_17740 [candidate division KSB1 bacterium]|nr:hypothetical protein [candidate division KSB1 bacterium]
MSEVTISKPIHKILTHLTGEERIDVALPLATRDLIQLKLKNYSEQIARFEERYRMTFDQFKIAWDKDQIPNKRSYEVEKDYWEWEAAVLERQNLEHLLEELQ